MDIERARLRDHIEVAAGYQRPTHDSAVIRGRLHVVLTGPDGEVKYEETVPNLVTRVGDQMYGEKGAGIAGAVPSPTGMQLGTGTTAVAKTGAGAALVTLVASSLVAIGTPTSAVSGSSRRITYVTTWAAGTATANAIAEVVLVNQSVGTQTATPEANTLARALLSPTVNKGASDSLTITWQHDILGA